MAEIISLIPIMTSNTSPDGEAFGSNVLNTSYSYFHVFDKKDNTSWTTSGGFPKQIGYKFVESKTVGKYTLKSRSFDQNDISTMPKSWTFEGSNDGVNYTVLDTQTNQVFTAKAQTKEFIVSNPKGFKYHRLNISANNGFPSATSLGELELFSGVTNKILIKTDISYVYLGQSGTWETLPNEPTVQDFLTYGMDELTDNMIQDFEGEYGKKYRIYRWTDGDGATSATLKAIPQPQLVYPNGDISINGVETIDSLQLIANGNVKTAVSFDSGVTWQSYDGTAWNIVVNASNGMDISTFNALTAEHLNEIRNGSNFIRFSYYLEGKDAETDHLKMTVSMVGYEQPANRSDWSYTYDQPTKTLTYNITKSGTYTVKYLDV